MAGLGPATHDFDFTCFYERPVKTGPYAETAGIIAVWYESNRSTAPFQLANDLLSLLWTNEW